MKMLKQGAKSNNMQQTNDKDDPTKDPDNQKVDTDDIAKEAFRIRDKLRPWNKQIMITLSLVFIFLVVFLGFAMGA